MKRLLVGLVALIAVETGAFADKSTNLAIVVNKANSTESLSIAELKQIFLADRIRWADGKKVVLVGREAGQPEHDAVLKWIYGMSEGEFKRFFIQATFTGKTQTPPKMFGSSAALKGAVGSVAGAVGYARASEADDSVKVLKIDGKLPGEAGYPLVVQ